jgi:1-acyl-sn-glycerol-3-phosphate acyltransferase
MQYLRSLVFTTFFMLWTLIYGFFFSLICPLLPFPRRFVLARIWARTLLGSLKGLCGLDYRVEGWENLPCGNHVALWKHSSTWETVAMTAIIPRQVWVLKRELTWIPFVGWGIRLLHAIAIDRKAGHSAVSQVVTQGKARLAEGSWIVIFPEGTRMPPGETRKYGASGALLASEAGKLVVPVAHDAGYYWPRRGLLKKRGTIRVMIGPPIDPAGRSVREINDAAQSWIESALRASR